MVVGKWNAFLGSLRCSQQDQRAHFGEERLPPPKKKKKKKKTKTYPQRNDQPLLTNFFSASNNNNNVVSWDITSVDKSGASMELSNNSSDQSVNTFDKDSAREHSLTQDEIDVENWGNSLPCIWDPGYTICIFQNIGPQPESGFNAKAHHNKNAFKALGSEVGLFAKHCLNKKQIRFMNGSKIVSKERTLTWWTTSMGLTILLIINLVALPFLLMLYLNKNNVQKEWIIQG